MGQITNFYERCACGISPAAYWASALSRCGTSAAAAGACCGTKIWSRMARAVGPATTPSPPPFSRISAIAIATRIWPNLRRVIAAGTGNFEIYTEKLQKYIGQIPIYNQIYASSEALIANETEADSKQYIVNTENCFLLDNFQSNIYI